MNLTGKYALISGASRGIGKAIAEKYFKEGATVYLLSRNAEELSNTALEIDPTGQRAFAVPCDVTSTTSIKEVFKRFKASDIYIDILVNAAGIACAKPIEDLDYEEWDRTINTNLTGLFMLCQKCLDGMKHKGGGKIINIASLMSEVARPGLAAYCASKGGLLMFTKCLAVEWAKYNIQANTIIPGYIDTIMVEEIRNNPSTNQNVINKTPAGRWGLADDVADVALFLASKNSNFITGADIPVDGGVLASLQL